MKVETSPSPAATVESSRDSRGSLGTASSASLRRAAQAQHSPESVVPKAEYVRPATRQGFERALEQRIKNAGGLNEFVKSLELVEVKGHDVYDGRAIRAHFRTPDGVSLYLEKRGNSFGVKSVELICEGHRVSDDVRFAGIGGDTQCGRLTSKFRKALLKHAVEIDKDQRRRGD